jgi:predicted transcriptional regulator
MIVGYLYNNNDRTISNKELNQHIYKLYFIKENAVKMRIDEQIRIGNVEQIESQYKLTNKGLIIVKIMSLITKIFNTKKNYIKNLD